MFVIISVVTLVVTIMALQSYFEKIWNQAVYEKVLSVPGEELGDVRSLSNWRLGHYEYADPSKTGVRLPMSAPRSCSWRSKRRVRLSIPASPPSRNRKNRRLPPTPAGAAPEAGKQPEPAKNQPEAAKK